VTDGKWAPKGNRVVRLNNLFAKNIIAVSEAVKMDLANIGINKDRIVTIYNSISADYLIKESPRLCTMIQDFKKNFDTTIGIAGTIEARKGLLECIQALSIVKEKKLKRVGLIVAGEAKEPSQKAYYTKLIETISKTKLNDHVLFLGQIKEVKTFFQEIDIFIHFPASPDPLPTVVLEAIVLDCAVIVSENGGNPEIVQYGRWGNTVPAKDVEQLANTILNPTLLSLSKEEYRYFTDYFSHQKKELAHVNLYDNIVNN